MLISDSGARLPRTLLRRLLPMCGTAVAVRAGIYHLVPDGAPLTLAAGPSTLRAGKGSDERGGAMRVGVGATLREPSA